MPYQALAALATLLTATPHGNRVELALYAVSRLKLEDSAAA